jgi:catalase
VCLSSLLTDGYIELANGGPIGRYGTFNEPFSQARSFWYSMDKYAQQHTINGYRCEHGQVMNTSIVGDYITKILNPIDNCFARRIAFGIGAPMPELGSASTRKPNATYPSSYPLGSNMSLLVAGLSIAALANDNALTMTDFQTLTAAFGEQKLNFAVIGPHAGMLATSVPANMSYLTGASVFYGAVVLGSGLNGTATDADPYRDNVLAFLREAYSRRKPLVAIGSGMATFRELGYSCNPAMSVFWASNAMEAASDVVSSLGSPGRYPMRMPVDDVEMIWGQ